MTRVQITKQLVLVALALALVLMASASGMRGVLDRTKGVTMTRKMKTVCVGRFLIDIPQEASVSLGRARVAGFDLGSTHEDLDTFNAALAARESELRGQLNELGKPSLESVREYKRNGYSGKILVFGRWRTSWIEGERRVHAEGVAIEGYLHGAGTSFSFSSSTADPAQAGIMARLFDQVSARDEGEVPGAAGFCIDRGFIREPLGADQRESVAMFARLPDHPDVGIAFSSIVSAASGPGLLKRTAEAIGRYPLFRPAVRTLREGARTAAGMAGEEVAVKVTELNFTTAFNFDWETRGKQMDVLAPLLTLELQTGVPRPGGKAQQSSLPEGVLVELWDHMLSSIRLRPVAVAKAAPAEQPPPALGTVGMAGTVCPFSGWWQCSDGGDGVAVLGGRRQFLRKGQRMPQALLLPEPKLWEKVRGLQPSHESATPTAWKLVDRRAAMRKAPSPALAAATAPAALEQDHGDGMAAVGSCAKTGERCPASGWWRCDDAQALDGTRWFATGSVLPAATFNMPPRWLGKSLSSASVIQRRCSWQLVRLAPSAKDGASGLAQPLVAEGAPA